MKHQNRDIYGNRLYSAGEMAAMNGVTKKTLRVYQENELLVPVQVNEEQGYRYYTLEQSSRLDTIQQFQEMGFSLKEIKQLLKEQDPVSLVAVLENKLKSLEKEKERIEIAIRSAEQLQECCRLVRNKPPCEQISVEWMPKRRLLYFDIREYDYSKFTSVQEEGFLNWELTLRFIKEQLHTLDLPISMLRNVGCIGAQSFLEKGKFAVTGAAIHIDDSFSHPGCRYYVLPAGLYISCYCEGDSDGCLSFERENALVHRLLDEIPKRGYLLSGDYYGDVLAETPLFRYAARENFLRLQIGIKNAE